MATTPSGLGELLRYLAELVDQGAEEAYATLGVAYKARYTPVMRAIRDGAHTVTDITQACRVTQGAISQTVGLMIADGLLERGQASDARKSTLKLTRQGKQLLGRLEPHWMHTFMAISQLESELGWPLLRVLGDTAQALEKTGFASRVLAASPEKGHRRHGS